MDVDLVPSTNDDIPSTFVRRLSSSGSTTVPYWKLRSSVNLLIVCTVEVQPSRTGHASPSRDRLSSPPLLLFVQFALGWMRMWDCQLPMRVQKCSFALGPTSDAGSSITRSKLKITLTRGRLASSV